MRWIHERKGEERKVLERREYRRVVVEEEEEGKANLKVKMMRKHRCAVPLRNLR